MQILKKNDNGNGDGEEDNDEAGPSSLGEKAAAAQRGA